MKKALILAYDFPPYVSVGGLRPYSWFRYLREFEIFPVVVTRQWNNKFGNQLDYVSASDSAQTIFEESEKGVIIRTPYSPNLSNKLLIKYGDSKFNLLRKSLSMFFDLGQFLFLIGTKVSLYKAAEKYLENNKIDVIIATGEPYVLFKYASKLSDKFGIPWIADYRDPWTQDKSRREKGFPESFDAVIEKRTLRNASAITTVSEFFQKRITTLITDKPFHIIENGYDEDEIEQASKVEQSKEKFGIAVVGTIYDYHPIESFLSVCNDFVNEFETAPDFEINFYGTNLEDKIRSLIENEFPALKSVVKIHPKLQNEELLLKLAANHVLLLFNYYSIVGTKIYNYLGLRRQIFLCYENDEKAELLKQKRYNIDEIGLNVEPPQIRIIKKTNSGVIIKDENHLRLMLEEFYSGFKKNGLIPCDSVNVENYSRKVQAEKLAGVIKNVIEKN